MIGDNEIVVLASSGTSPGKIARPALVLAGLLTLINLVLNLWIVPLSQAKFYDTQWNLRYGLAHLKLQEGAFTEMSRGLVVYVDKVSGHDLNQVMLSDMRKDKSQMTIFAQKGKLVTTIRGLSIIMTNGSLQATGNGDIIGTFDNFDMDLSITERSENNSFKSRRISSWDLLRSVKQDLTQRQRKAVFTELCTRFLQPIMNFILAALCLTILLRSSLLRRRASFAPAFAVIAMSATMAAFMSTSNMLASMTDLLMLAGAQFIVLGIIMVVLLKK